MRRIALISILLISIVAGRAQTLSAFVDFAKFKVNDTLCYAEIYVGIEAPSTVLVSNEDGKYQSHIFAAIQLTKKDKIVYFEKFNIESPLSDSPKPSFDKFNFSKRIFTTRDTFECMLVLRDLYADNAPDTVNFTIDNGFNSEKIMFSSIQLVSDYEPSDLKNDFTKGGYLLNPNTSSFYPNSDKKLKYYLEAYNLDKQLGEDEPFVLFSIFRDKNGRKYEQSGSFKRAKATPDYAILNEVDISKLPSGNYFFIIELRDKENKLIAYTGKKIQRANTDLQYSDEPDDVLLKQNFTHAIKINDLNYYLECLNPIASETEMATIGALIKRNDSTESRNYFFNFWYKRHKSEAQKEWIKYHRNIRQVDEEFSCFGRPGYITEQGRVYLKYGAPNRLETEFTEHGRDASSTQKEFQIWNYYTLPDGQRNRFFVFLRPNPGSCEYEIIHSNVRDEYQNQDWIGHNNWRELLRQNRGNGLKTIDTDELSSEF